MTSRRPSDSSGFRRLDIVRAVSLMGVAVLVVGAGLERDREGPAYPEPIVDDGVVGPIAAEARVFRIREDQLAVAPDFGDEREGHVRSMEMYRRLRAYPGAPPRVPHGLTVEEFREQSCNVCHERGGWVARFGTYAPVSPHPEASACLQCHLMRDELVGRPRPESEDAVVCVQCHVDPDARPATFADVDWPASAWPSIDLPGPEGGPTLIPHSVEARADCLACHSGPAAVVGLRTDHPERVNCRQCHVPAAPDPGPWPPAGTGAPGGGGGAP
jgi:cytochrome c-type protein NapB